MITNGVVEFTWPSSYSDNRPGAKVTLSFDTTGLDANDHGVVVEFIQRVGDVARAEATRLQTGEVATEKKTRTTKKETPAAPLPVAVPSTPGPVAPTAMAPTPVSVAPPSPTVPAAPGAAFNAAGQPASPTSAQPVSLVPPPSAVPAPSSTTTAISSSPTAPVAPLPAATAPAPVAGPSTPAAPTAGVAPVAPAAPAVGPGASATDVISDEQITKRCQDKTDELNALYEPGVGLQKVIAIVCNFVQPPGRATQIPVEHRQNFLTQLAMLA